MKKLILITAAIAALSLTGCTVPMSSKSDITQLSAKSSAKIEVPVSVAVEFENSSDEDLRPAIETAIRTALKTANVPETATSSNILRVKITSIKRKSRMNDFLWGNMSGRAHVFGEINFPNNDNIMLDGRTQFRGRIATPSNSQGTEDAIVFFAEALAAETKARL